MTHYFSYIILSHTIFNTIFLTYTIFYPPLKTIFHILSFTHYLWHTIFYTQLFTHHLLFYYTIFITYYFSSHHFSWNNFIRHHLSSTSSFAFPSFPVPITTFLTYYWKKLINGIIRSFYYTNYIIININILTIKIYFIWKNQTGIDLRLFFLLRHFLFFDEFLL